MLAIAATILPNFAFAATAVLNPDTFNQVGDWSLSIDSDNSQDLGCYNLNRPFIKIGIAPDSDPGLSNPDSAHIFSVETEAQADPDTGHFNFIFHFLATDLAADFPGADISNMKIYCSTAGSPDVVWGSESMPPGVSISATFFSDTPMTFNLPPPPQNGAWPVAFFMSGFAGLLGILIFGFSRIF